MKQYITTYLITLILGSIHLQLPAQSLKFQWQTSENISAVTINHVFQSSDNRLVAVGSARKDDAEQEDTEGVLIFIDEKTGAIQKTKTFERKGFNSFLTVVELESGGFYLIGETGSSKEKTVGWIVAVDEMGESMSGISERLIENYIRIEKVIKDDNGRFLFIGQKQKEGLGLLRLKKAVIDLNVPTSFKQLDNVLCAQFNATNELNMIGKNLDNGLVWRALWAENKSDSYLYKKSSFSPIPDIQDARFLSKPYLFGTAFVKGRNNIWIGSANDSTRLIAETILSSNKATEDFHGVLPLTENNCLMAYSAREQRTGFSKNSFCTFNMDNPKERIELKAEEVGYKRDFKITQLIKGFGNNVFVLGKIERENKPTKWRILAYKWAETEKSIASTSKSINDIFRFAKAEFDDSEFENGDKILSPNEKGAAVFTVETSLPIATISVEAKIMDNARGVMCNGGTRRFNIQNGKTRVNFPISATADLSGGVVGIQFSIKAEGYPAQTFAMKISCNNPLSKKGVATIVDYDDKSLKSGRTVSNPTITVKGKVFTPPGSNPKVVVNNAAKENTILNRLYDVNGNMTVYQFSHTLTLVPGWNAIPVRVDDENGTYYDTLKINFVSKIQQKPTLHIIAIAPNYSNPNHKLAFNQKDADDIVEIARKQAGRGVFDEIKIKKLTSTQETTADNIKRVFRELSRRAKKDYENSDAIGVQDVIWVFFSSHGKMIKNKFKILPSNYADDDDEEQEESSVDYRTAVLDKLQEVVKEETQDTNRRKIIVFIDACHSGGAKSKGDLTNDEINSMALNALNSSAAGIITVSSTTDSLLSYEDALWQNGAFTKALVEALDNQKVTKKNGSTLSADTNLDKIITIEEMYNFLKIRIPDLINQIHNSASRQQEPFIPTRQLKDNLPVVRLN